MAIAAACSEEKNEIKSTDAEIQVDYMIVQNTQTDHVLSIPGSILPFEYVEIFPEISGRLKSIHFIEGQKVKKGQLLFKLDTELQHAQLKQIQSDLDFAKKDEQRKKALWEAKSISLEDYELSQSKKMNLEAQVDVLQIQIEKGSILAPFNGTVGLRDVSEGAMIGPTTKLTSLAQNDRIKIEFALAERYATSITLGTSVSFNLANKKDKLSAKIYAVAPVIDAQTRMLSVRAVVESNTLLIPGSFVEVDFKLASNEKSVLVPATALVPVLNGQKIWKINKGLAQSVTVEPGLRNKQDVEVFGDIKTGDTIILSGLLAMRDGTTVTIKQK